MSAPAVDHRTSRRGGAGSAPGPADRLPAPVKERRPALAALAVILIVGGALASGLLVLRSGERDDYLVVTRTINPGQQISEADLGVAQISGTGANAVTAARRADIVGGFATTRIFPGTLITYDMVAEDDEIPNGSVVVGAVLSTNQRPAAPLRPGDLVEVLSVPRSDGSGTDQANVLLDSAEVLAVEETSTNGAVAVSLLVPLDQVRQVAAAAAQGGVAVALLPGLAAPPATDSPPEAPQTSPTSRASASQRPTSQASSSLPAGLPSGLASGLPQNPVQPGTP